MSTPMEKFVAAIVLFVGFVAVVMALGLLMSYPLMLLWNGCLVPAVTGLQPVTWIQAWGINIACSILFKSSSVSSSK